MELTNSSFPTKCFRGNMLNILLRFLHYNLIAYLSQYFIKKLNPRGLSEIFEKIFLNTKLIFPAFHFASHYQINRFIRFVD